MGETLNYHQHGTGTSDILFVHGWASSSRMWQIIVEELAPLARLWTVDLVGFGQTPIVDKPYSVAEHSQALSRFCDEHDLKPQVIIAHSMGGLVALKMLHERPDLAQQLVLICPVVTGNFGLGVLSALFRNQWAAHSLKNSEALLQALKKDYFLRTIPMHPKPYVSKIIQEDWIEMQTSAAIKALITMPHEDTRPFLKTLLQPTLITVGDYDTTVPPSEGRIAADYLPHAELVNFSKSRHRPHDEESEKFLPLLREFLARYGIA